MYGRKVKLRFFFVSLILITVVLSVFLIIKSLEENVVFFFFFSELKALSEIDIKNIWIIFKFIIKKKINKNEEATPKYKK